jgi:hypothetical protein
MDEADADRERRGVYLNTYETIRTGDGVMKE